MRSSEKHSVSGLQCPPQGRQSEAGAEAGEDPGDDGGKEQHRGVENELSRAEKGHGHSQLPRVVGDGPEGAEGPELSVPERPREQGHDGEGQQAPGGAVEEAAEAAADGGAQHGLQLQQKPRRRVRNRAYNDFCAENGLKRQQERLHIAGWNKSQASAASAAARKNSVQNSDDLPSDSEINLERTSSDVDKMLNEYSSRDSKWSRNTIVKNANSMPGVMGRKEWGCDITLREDAGFKTVVHEHLHARSISYYDQKTYIIHQRIEEATVELYAQEICKQRDIAFRPAYAELVQKLQIINSITRHGTLFDFAKELFDIPLKNRYSWLRERANEVIATGKLSVKTEESLNEAVDYFHGKALDNG